MNACMYDFLSNHSLKQHEERYVIEIYVSKNIDQVYQTGSKK